jgi:L-ascorbate metabolism protein UlaG (beta-lactamase superfamily)
MPVMDITYLGHSAFKLTSKIGTVVMDPYSPMVGWSLPRLSADIVTVSHQHPDHNDSDKITGTARRERPFLVSEPGEYEVGGISVFGIKTFHDAHSGSERGANTIFTVLVEGVKVCHLGDLGHELTADQISDIGEIDVLLCPVGGSFTIDPVQAVKTINDLEPRIAIPMHFKTEAHDEKVFADLKTLAEFCKEYGAEVAPLAKLSVEAGKLPEETELCVLSSVAA